MQSVTSIIHNYSYNSALQEVLQKAFPGIVLRTIKDLNTGDDAIEIVKLDQKGTQYKESCAHTLLMSITEKWVLVDQDLYCVAAQGMGFDSLVRQLQESIHMWAGKPPRIPTL